MKKYEIVIREYDRRNEEIEAESFDDACEKLEEMINSGELFLDSYNYSREYENATSKKFEKGVHINIDFDSDTNTVVLNMNGKKISYDNCFSVRDLKTYLCDYCDAYLEDKEIEMVQEKDMEL